MNAGHRARTGLLTQRRLLHTFAAAVLSVMIVFGPIWLLPASQASQGTPSSTTSTTTSTTSSSTTNQTLSQLLAALQANGSQPNAAGSQNSATNPLSIILNTLSSAGVNT